VRGSPRGIIKGIYIIHCQLPMWGLSVLSMCIFFYFFVFYFFSLYRPQNRMKMFWTYYVWKHQDGWLIINIMYHLKEPVDYCENTALFVSYRPECVAKYLWNVALREVRINLKMAPRQRNRFTDKIFDVPTRAATFTHSRFTSDFLCFTLWVVRNIL